MEYKKINMPGLLHGGDYNPEQWLDRPDILEEDIRLMKLAHVNNVSLGIFSWAFLEPEEGKYQFDYLEEIINRLYDNGIYTNLATPTGAMPNWMTQKYPEVMQTDENGIQNLPGKRHNFCYTSAVMREKTRKLDLKLSERFGKHPGVILWHISNEYGGNFRDASCHCEECQKAFRKWLKKKYKTLDALNHAWWSAFWSHTYTDWEQIHSPSPRGEDELHGLKLDWKRFVSEQLQDFCREEIRAVKTYSDLPVTTNMMMYFSPLDYDKWAEELDVISWDSYPSWHTKEDEVPIAVWAAFMHNQMRGFQKKPFLMMESTPSLVNWDEENNVKRPGMNYLSSMQAIALGSNSVLYFQWRKSRGSSEKFHGAVVDHDASEKNRVFQEVAWIGKDLEKLSSQILSTCNRAKVAIIMDWENWWALSDAQAISRKFDYTEELLKYYRVFWEKGIEVDIISMDRELLDYQLVVAPTLYLYKKEYIHKVEAYVEAGGIYVTTYWSGVVNETDLCFIGERPHERLLGLSVDEIDVGNEYFPNTFSYKAGVYKAGVLREVVTLQTAKPLGTYLQDYNVNTPAITENAYGKGKAYYVVVQPDLEFLKEFLGDVIEEANVEANLTETLPYGVTVSKRSGKEQKDDVYFLQNFNRHPVKMVLNECYTNLITDEILTGSIKLQTYQCIVMQKK